MKKFVALLTKEKEKTTMTKQKNDDSGIFRALYSIKKYQDNSLFILTR